MNKLDLRQVGTIFGHALYVDVADTIDLKGKDDVLSSRDREELMVTSALQDAFKVTKQKKENPDEEN